MTYMRLIGEASSVLPFWAAVLLGFGVVARATRFINDDVLAAPIRVRIKNRFGNGKIYYLATCPWCASIWIAAPVAVVVVLAFSQLAGFSAVFTIVALWLAYSYVYGLVATNLDGE